MRASNAQRQEIDDPFADFESDVGDFAKIERAISEGSD
jgi:hypothetical protein